MDPATLSKYDRPAPRYTSYPTAAQFHAGVGADEYRRWASDLPVGQRLSLYLHVPFCAELCWYCACHTRAVRSPTTLEAYARALHSEIDLVSQMLASRRAVCAVQWGGGTPTHLGVAAIGRLAEHIEQKFDISADAERSLEIDPRRFEPETAAALAGAGFNRISLGVQDFAPAVQAAINRLQDLSITSRAVEALRANGIDAINIDLVYGLPRQTLETLETTLRQALSLSPSRFAVFGYAHVPWMKPHQRLIDAAELPDAATRYRMAALVADVLTDHGYRRVGLDHFARPDDSLCRAAETGGLSRNFQGYTDTAAQIVLGFGASAIGTLPRGYVQNTTDIGGYMRTVERGGLATARGVAIEPGDRLCGEIIERLMCDFSVDLAEIGRRHAVEIDRFAPALEALQPFVADGLAERHGPVVAMTPRGLPLVRSVAALFDPYFTAREGRHARAI